MSDQDPVRALPSESLTVSDEAKDLRARLLPLLVGQVFHFTPRERVREIVASGAIKNNRCGTLGRSAGYHAVNAGVRRGGVCFFDLRGQTVEQVDEALSKLYFLAPPGLGDDIAYMFLAAGWRDELVSFEDLVPTPESWEFRIPFVERWFPQRVPVTAIERVLFVHVERRPVDSNSWLAIVAAVAGAERAERRRHWGGK